jgi:hypothetical protein
MTFTKLAQTLRKIHPLIRIGAVGLGLSFAANYYIISATPTALWNGPRSVVEHEVVLGLQILSMALILIGRGLVIYREVRAEREQGNGAA